VILTLLLVNKQFLSIAEPVFIWW